MVVFEHLFFPTPLCVLSFRPAGNAPPGSRTESLANVYPHCTPKSIHIDELSILSSQPNTVRLSTLLLRHADKLDSAPRHVMVYFQGK
jgi:hypothetical protein